MREAVVWVVLGWVSLIAGVVGASAQQLPPPPNVPDQLAQCQSLLRVKQDMPCRCDSAEALAALLLRRAEKAEQQVDELTSKLAQANKRGDDLQKQGLDLQPKDAR